MVRILAGPDSGWRVIAEVNALQDVNGPEVMCVWLEAGYRLAQAEDDRVAITRSLTDPSIRLCGRAARCGTGTETPDTGSALLDDHTIPRRRAQRAADRFHRDGLAVQASARQSRVQGCDLVCRLPAGRVGRRVGDTDCADGDHRRRKECSGRRDQEEADSQGPHRGDRPQRRG